jgi:uncharacterized membrane protein YccC
MTDGAPDGIRKGIGFPTVAIVGILCGVAASFFGIAWVGLVFFIWLMAPLFCAYFVRRHQVMAATMFNMLVMVIPVLRGYFDPLSHELNRDTLSALGIMACVGVVLAQTAWLSVLGRRETKPQAGHTR